MMDGKAETGANLSCGTREAEQVVGQVKLSTKLQIHAITEEMHEFSLTADALRQTWRTRSAAGEKSVDVGKAVLLTVLASCR